MAYDERLAEEVRERLAAVDGEVVEKRMFGGLAFMVDGNLTVAASRRGGLLVRTDPGEADEVLALPGGRADGDAGPADARLGLRRRGGHSTTRPSSTPGSAAPWTSSAACRRSERRGGGAQPRAT